MYHTFDPFRGLATTPDVLRARTTRQPDRPAILVDGVGAITFREIDERSTAIALRLRQLGVRRRDCVGVRFRNTHWIDCTVAYFGIHKLGATVVSIPTADIASNELNSLAAYTVEHARCVGLICQPELRLKGFSGWMVSVAEALREAPAGDLQPMAAPDDPSEITYTSGTTGLPKGVVGVHTTATFECRVKEWHADDILTKMLLCQPLEGGSFWQILTPFFRGESISVVMQEFDPYRFCYLIESEQIQKATVDPNKIRIIIDSGAHRRYSLASLTTLVFGSDRLPPVIIRQLHELLPGVRIGNTYGSSEVSPATTVMVHDEETITSTRSFSVGLPQNSTEVKIVDENDVAVPTGQVGEIWLRLSTVPQRWYHRDTTASRRVFRADGWTRTGDLGFVDGDGYLFLVDRWRDYISRGVRTVSTIEVEGALLEHHAVSDASCFAVPHALLGEDVAAAVVVREAVTAGALQKFVAGRLPPYKVPKTIYLINELPRNRSGKVLKEVLRRRLKEEL